MSDHLHRLQTVYDERFAREYGPWRPVVTQVADKFLACGILEHGFARVRCDACTQVVSYAFATPPPDVPAKRTFDTPEWKPRTYVPLKTVWCED